MLKFGPIPIERAHIFAETVLSFAFVNLKPVVPGVTMSLALPPPPDLDHCVPTTYVCRCSIRCAFEPTYIRRRCSMQVTS